MSAAFAARKAMLAKVHIAKKALQLDDVAYGEVLLRVVGESSAKSLTQPRLDALLREFKRLGWVAPAGTGSRSAKPSVRMIHGVWKDLAPYVSDRSPEALRAFVRRQTRSKLHPDGVAAPEFLDPRQVNLVLEGLKAWLSRARREASAATASQEAGNAR